MNLDKRLLKEAGAVRLYLALTVGLGLLAGITTVLQALYLSRVTSQVFLEGHSFDQVRGPLQLLLLVVVARAALVGVREIAANRVAGRIKLRLRERLFAHILALGPAFSSGERTGELANTLQEGIESLEAYFGQYLPSLALAALVPITILLFVFPLDLISGLVFLLTAPLIPIFMILIGKRAEILTRRQWETLSRLSAHFLDVLQGLTTLKLFGRSRAQVEILARFSDRFRTTTLGVLRVAFLSALTLELLSTLSTAIVAVEVGLRLLYGSLSFEQAFFVLILAPEFYLPLRNLGAGFHAGTSGVAAARRIFDILENDGAVGRQRDKRDEQDRQPAVHPCPVYPAHPISSSSPFISFEDVQLAYDGGERPALKGITFQIARGEREVLAGPSGAGKSSIALLLMGFLQPDRGRILVDGQPLMDLQLEEWRRHVAWVPQHPYMFHASVADNLRLARPEATPEQLIQAARLAGAHDFVARLPQGYNTVIGERAERLSGGQAQLLALARAFLKDAPFLILDEAAAHLDPQLETQIQETIERLMEGRTVLAITHNPMAARWADRILLLERGRLVEAGRHLELLRKEGLHRPTVAPFGDDERPECLVPEVAHVGRELGSGAQGAALHLETAEWRIKSLPQNGHTVLRILQLAAPFKGWMVLAGLLGFATIGSAIGLMSTAAFLIASAALHPSVADLAVAIVGVRFFGLARGLFRYLERYLSHSVTFRLLARLRVWFYQALEPQPPAWLMGQRSGDLLNRIVTDVDTLQHFYVRVISPPVVALLTGVVMWLFMSSFDVSLALVLTLFLLLSGLVLPIATLLMSRRLGQEGTRLRGELNVRLVDSLQGMADLLAFGQGSRQQATVRELGRRWLAVQERMAAISGLHSGLTSLLANAGMLAVLATAIPLVAGGRLEGVFLPVVTLAALACFEAVAPLPAAFQQLGSSVEAARRLFEIVDAGLEAEDLGRCDAETPGQVGVETVMGRTEPRAEPRRRDGCAPNGTGQAGPPRPRQDPRPVPAQACTLVVEDLRFRYGPNEPLALDGVSFQLPDGGSLAIIGPSGSGKSTLVNLLVRFWDYQEGLITLGGRDLRSYDRESLLRMVAVISQRTHLFNGTIRENLKVARPEATEVQLREAMEQAQLGHFLDSLPLGFDTPVGELGLRLSGGERQRLAIARALLKDAPLLILDEPTTHLDHQTELGVMSALRSLMGARTSLLITHRVTGLESVGQILAMDRGRIVDRGNHSELLTRQGLYRSMRDLQREATEEYLFTTTNNL